MNVYKDPLPIIPSLFKAGGYSQTMSNSGVRVDIALVCASRLIRTTELILTMPNSYKQPGEIVFQLTKPIDNFFRRKLPQCGRNG